MTKASKSFKLPIPKGHAIDISKIYNPVDPKNMKKRKPKKITDLVSDAEQNIKIMNAINDKKAKGIKFSLSDFGIPGYTELGDILFDEVAQREINLPHVGNIITKFSPSLTSPAFLADAQGNKYSSDTQHGTVSFALLCKHGLIEGVDPDNYLKTPYPSYTIPNATSGLPAYCAMTRNGLGQKKWNSIDKHKAAVGLAREYPDVYGMQFAKEARIQDLCEKYEAIPVSKDSKYSGKAGTIDRVDSLYKDEDYQCEYVLERHKAYWHGTCLDTAAYGFYGNIIEYCKAAGIAKKDMLKLTDHLTAIVADFFTDLAEARTEVLNTHERWHRACNPLTKNAPNPKDNCFLAIMEKIYLKLNGPCQVTSNAYSHVHDNKDIFDYLPDDILNRIDNHVQNNIAW